MCNNFYQILKTIIKSLEIPHNKSMPEKFEEDAGSGFEIKYEGYPMRIPLLEQEHMRLNLAVKSRIISIKERRDAE